MKKTLLALLMGAALLGGAAYWQYKPYLEYQIESILRDKGLQNVYVSIAHIGFGGASFQEIRFGAEDNPLIFKDVQLKYTLSDLSAGRLDEIVLENLVVSAMKEEDGWVVYGLEGLQSAANKSAESDNPLAFIPVNAAGMDAIPFRYLGIKNSALDITGTFGEAHIPLNIEWSRGEEADLSYQAEEITATLGNIAVSVLNPQFQASMLDDMWKGVWRVTEVKSDNDILPSLGIQGQIEADQNHIRASGDFVSDDQSYSGDFTVEYTPLAQPSFKLQSAADIHVPPDVAPVEIPPLKAMTSATYDGLVFAAQGHIFSDDKSWNADYHVSTGNAKSAEDGMRISSAVMPWNEGRISIKDVWYPLNPAEAIPIKVAVDKVALASLLSTMTGDRIQAQGLVSGYVNIEIAPDGSFTILNGDLAAEGPGTIMMPPEVIPASNDEVDLVKDIMEDLHFKVLNISATPDANRQVGIKLSVEGNNPKVYDGYPVKLNINLTGNLIDFIEQNVMLLTKPEKFLKGNVNENEQ